MAAPAIKCQLQSPTISASVPCLRSDKGSKSAQIITPRSDIQNRIKSTLQQYPGITSHEELLKKKAQEGRQRLRATETEYWAWNKKMKSEVGPHWKMPEDSYIGKRPVEEECLEKVEKAQKAMAETTANYKAWVKDMEKKRQEELNAKVQERQQELRNFAQKRQQARMERAESMEADAEAKAQQAGRYWTWLSETKTAIARRETQNAPLAKHSGAKSVQELTEMKKAQLAEEIEERERQYKEWLESIRHPKSRLPWQKCNSVQERDAIIHEKAKKGQERLNKTAAEYNAWVKEMEQQHHERTMAKVREKLLADQEYRRKNEMAAEGLRVKMQEAKRQQQEIEAESQRALKEMYDRVQTKPLLVEQAYRHNK